ncbi:MAG: hypothetical protein ACI8YQ_001850 [Polaribacter sp.]|jgi:hypothetical protein
MKKTTHLSHLIVFCFCLLNPFGNDTLAQSIFINEILASNSNTNTDEFGESDDWVELYNATSNPIDIGGMYLTDDLGNLVKYYIPPTQASQTTIPAMGYLLVWCDNQSNQGAMHTTFKLSASGESFALVDSDGTTVIDSYTYGIMSANVSIGREQDGQTPWVFFSGPTPDDSNGGTTSVVDMPVANQVGGHFSSGFLVTLTTTSSNATIYYTTNGSEPTENDNEFSTPFYTSTTTVLRARAFATDMEPSRTMTHTYLFDIDHTLPIICLSTDDDHFWDEDEGIYENYLDRIEQPVHVELYEADGNFGFRQDMGIQIHGRYSQTYPHKGLSFRARNSYGSNKINYPLFPTQDYDQYGSFILRASGNDWKRMLCRDALASSLVRDIAAVDSLIKDPDLDLQDFRPVIVYLNGEYFGIHNLREKMDYRYLKTHYDIDKDAADLVVNTSNADHGNTDAWDAYQEFIEGADFNQPDDLAEIQANIKLDHFFDYFIFNIYIDNNDWPGNNNRRWRLRQEGERWRFFVYDLDGSLGLNPLSDDYNSGDWTSPSIEMVMADTETYNHNEPYSTVLLRKLMENDSLRIIFFNRMADQLNILFTEDRTQERINEFEALYVAEIPQHADFWWDGDNDWAGDLDIARLFATHRNEEVFNQVHDYFSDDIDAVVDLTLTAAPLAGGVIHLNTTHLFEAQFPWSGRHFAGIDVPLYTIPNPGYTFTEWTPSSLGTEAVTTMNLSGDETITAHFQLGSTQIGDIVINEINYNSPNACDAGDWIELHNAGATAVDVSGWFLEDGSGNYFNIPANTSIEAGGFLVLVQDQIKFTTVHPQVTNIVSNFGNSITGGFGLSNGGEWISINNANRSFRDTVRYDDALPWPIAADGTGASLELISPTLDNAMAQSWFSVATEKGSPGITNQGVLQLGNDLTSCNSEVFTLDASFAQCNNCTYIWSTGSVLSAISVNPLSGANLYSVTVTDANGITQSDDITITVSEPFTLTYGSQEPCFGESNGTIDLQANGNSTFSYNWSNGATTPTLNTLTSGTYTVTVSNALSCTEIETVQLLDAPALILQESLTEILCFGELAAIDLTMSGGQAPYTYAWSNGTSTEDLNSLPQGDYSVIISDSSNCTVENTYTFEFNSDALEGNLITESSCFGNDQGMISAAITGGTGDYLYQWSNGQSGTDNEIEGLLPGTYQLTVTDENGCTLLEETVVAGYTTMNSSISTTNTLGCFGDTNGSLNLSVNGGLEPYNYNWSNQQSGDSLQNLPGGIVAVTITDQANCQHYDSISIFEPAAISLDVELDDIKCTGGSDGNIALMTSGGTGTLDYLWGNSTTENELSNLTPGNYNITITDDNNCTYTESFSLTAPSPISFEIETAAINCYEGADGNINLTASGGTGDFDFDWSNGGTQNEINNLISGQYFITATDANNCAHTDSVFLSQPDAPISVDVAVDAVNCFGGTDGNINLTAIGGTGSLAYQWDNGTDEANNNNLTEGTYNIIITDANNCEYTEAVYLPQAPAISLDIAVDPINCADGADGSITVTASGGSGTLDYEWSNGGSSTVTDNLTAGEYILTITDSNNCEHIEPISISEALPITLDIEVNDVNCTDGTDGNIILTTYGGTGTISYAWDNGSNDNMIDNIAEGNYEVTLTDANNCEQVELVYVSEPTPISVTAEVAAINCNEGTDGSIIVSASGGTGNLTYEWSNSGTENAIDNLSEGNYNITITDANNCEIIENFDLVSPTPISLAIEADAIDCFEGTNGSLAATATGGTGTLSYEWSNGETGTMISDLVAGLYDVTITDANNCEKVEEMSLTSPSDITTDVEANAISCFEGANGNILVTASGGTENFSYEWSNGDIENSTNNLSEGNYNITITDTNNCAHSETVYISEPSQITLDAVVGDISCASETNGSINVTASGGTGNLNYAWSNGITGTEVNDLADGPYELTITDDNNCETIESFTIAAPFPINFEYTFEGVSCFGETNGSLSILAAGGTGPLSYQWANGETGSELNNLAAGNYEFTITDGNNCTKIGDVNVTEPPAIVLDVLVDAVDCFEGTNGNISVTASGGTDEFTYAWSNGMTEAMIVNLAAGNYEVTVTDSDGCTNVEDIEVAEAALIVFDITVDPISCFGGSDGILSITTSGGTGTVAFEWNDGTTDSSLPGLGEGSYSVTVTDENNCQQMNSIVLFEPPLISLESELDSIDCFGDMDGSIMLSPSGGAGGFDYLWSNGDIESTISDLTAGDYDVTITDANNCELVESFSLDQASALDVASTSTNPMSSLAGNISVAVSGGTMPYTILWDNGADTFEITDLIAGSYTYTVTDANGCVFEETIVLEFINALDNPDDYSLSIYPNPTKGMVYIKSDLTEMTLVVYDLLGRPLRNFEKDQTGDLWSVDMGGLSPGLYCLKIGFGEVEILEMVVVE